MSEEFEPCPWCGCDDIAHALTQGFPVYAECRNCGAQGPSKFTAREANFEWNTRPVPPMQRLHEWFARQCDGEREHMSGVSIKTTDNPGWWVTVDLEGTTCADMPSPGSGDLKRDGISFAVSDMTLNGYDEGVYGPERVVQVLMDIIDEYEANIAKTKALTL